VGGSLPVLVGERVAVALGRPVAVTGLGVSGARTATVLAEQVPRLGGRYDAVVVMVGANDATHATPWWRLRRDLDAVIRAARGRAPVVVLGGTPRFHRNRIIPEPIRTVLDRYSTLLRGQQRAAVRAVAGVAFVDIAAEASPRFLGVPEATSVDGFHPSPIGYGFWADALAGPVVAGLSDASH
jgi:lysophospholipase L1-like esterase